jgi:RND family efflux transporter MFP subunit
MCCGEKRANYEALAMVDSSFTSEAAQIQTALATTKPFIVQVITNGKVFAGQETPMSFENSGIIDKIFVKNGEVVKPDQLLASLDNLTQKLVLREAKLQFEESLVEISDQLITQGGRRDDSASVSREVFSYIKLRSGYQRALLNVQRAQLDLSKTLLYAPFGGTIANIKVSSFTPTPGDGPFCTLLNRDEMLVRCSILETELAIVELAQTASVEPIGRIGEIYKAKVIHINPIVNPQGLIEVTIKILKPSSRLLSGMNVRVVIERPFPRQLVIEKEAVVERSGRKVVFSYKDGRAKWNYVETGRENDKEIIITEGITSGEEVIITGNLNLGHDTKVEKISNKSIR